MADLYERLKRIRSAGRAGKPPIGSPAEETGADARTAEPGSGGRAERKRPRGEVDASRRPGADAGLGEDDVPVALGPDWRRVAPLVFVRETAEEVQVARAGDRVRPYSSRLLGRSVDLETIRFMDTETTGLSGGAGTTVFLVGAGRLAGSTLRVEQVLLVDFPGEPEFLTEVAGRLDGDVWVSYNGKAFDARLLESRFLMNGMRPMAADQLDLLTWSRRLWKAHVGSCSLGDIEREILARGRTDDIPGVEIPERYFRFLRNRDGAELDEVFEHHRLDIVSLAHLFFRLEAVLADPLGETRVDCYRLGRWLLASGEDAGIALLERALDGENRADAVRAALLLCRAYRRAGRSEAALRALARVEAERTPQVLAEEAKILEHDLHEPRRAADRVRAFLGGRDRADLPGDPSPVTRALEHRLRRLEAKSRAYSAASESARS